MSISKNNNSDIAILLKDTPADGVLRLSLNDSKRRNALSEEMMKQMSSALEKASGNNCLLYTSPSPRDRSLSRMPSSA